ncbi:MAG: S1 RNA-binding domain-containing protein [Clostridia bacterium]|nr:S1 RNA-binding domain-containing protein [Clostridia bacterium]
MRLELGAVVEGKITGITKFGAFVDLGEGKSGLVHISEVSNFFVKEINEHLKEGQTVKVKIIKLNDKGKYELSIKQASEEILPSQKKVQKNDNFSFKPKNQALSFEDMINKFKKSSDEKLSDFKKKTEVRRPRNAYKSNN